MGKKKVNKPLRHSRHILRGDLPPYSLDAEQAVLGGIMLDPNALERLEGILSTEQFYIEANRHIFSAIVELAQEHKPVDALMVKDKLERSECLDSCGGEAYLAELISSVPTCSNVRDYAKIVREKFVLRHLLQVCNEISRGVYEEAELKLNERLDQAESSMLAVSDAYESSGSLFKKVDSLLTNAYQKLQKRYELKQDVTGVATGFTDLDKLTAGLQRGDLIVVAGRPSMGKTAFAMNLAQNAAIRSEQDLVAAIFSLEMPDEQITMRMLAVEARVDMSKMRNGRFSKEDWRKMAGALGPLAEANIYIDDTPAITAMKIRSKCRRLKREAGRLDLVLIDYLQLMQGSANAERREQEISAITRSLKSLAKEMEVPVIVLSQLNRSLDSRTDKRPVMSDLRESGAIEQDADVIMFIYRDEVYNKQPRNEGIAEIIIAKQRNGPIDTVRLAFLKQYTRFENLSNYDTYD